MDFFRDIAEEIAAENGLSFRLGLIDSEQDKEYLVDKLRADKIRPLGRLCHLPIGRGCCAEKLVPENLGPD